MKSERIRNIRIGTRASALALAQSNEVKRRLLAAWPDIDDFSIELVPMTTTGDKITDRKLSEIGGKGLFTKEIEEALLDGTVDIAVHSMKDMPAQLPPGLIISSILPREDVRDALISVRFKGIDSLPEGAVVGTSSLRREAQLHALRPDLKVVPFRGNVLTRLEKLHRGEVDATILAVAGLNRLEKAEVITGIFSCEEMLPAVAQGAIGIECCEGNMEMQAIIAAINHEETKVAVTAERAFMEALEGNCRTPIAAYATLWGEHMVLDALIATTDGKTVHKIRKEGSVKDAYRLGKEAGEELKIRGGAGFFS